MNKQKPTKKTNDASSLNTKGTEHNQKALSTVESAYNEVPYESHPFSYTRPEHLSTVAKLFGMNPPAIETAKVLELGCASGGNIINFAENYPKSHTIGIDLSKVQIDQGQKIIKELGLKNIELQNVSITDLDESFGKFDYIICHGILSWVPEFVREKIFEVSKKLLQPNGLAFISYNTLPGWNMVNTIRDMMMFHSSLFSDAKSKVQQSRLFLNFVCEALEGSKLPYALFLQEEAKKLSVKGDYYLMHEYLEENNAQFYFHDFVKKARAQGLNYLADANIHSMFLGNMPKKAVEKLKSINDIVRTEQYMDFINNRRFRSTILCHSDAQINRNINSQKLAEFYTTYNLTAKLPEKDVDLDNALEPLEFYFNDNRSNPITTSSPVLKALFYAYSENISNPIKCDELIKIAHKKLPRFSLQDFKTEFFNVLATLVFRGHVLLYAKKPNMVYEVSDKPKVSNFARFQTKAPARPNTYFITNQINNIVALKLHEKYILELLDGTNTIAQIEDKLLALFNSGEISFNDKDGKKVEDKKWIEKFVKTTIPETLEKFKKCYLLIG